MVQTPNFFVVFLIITAIFFNTSHASSRHKRVYEHSNRAENPNFQGQNYRSAEEGTVPYRSDVQRVRKIWPNTRPELEIQLQVLNEPQNTDYNVHDFLTAAKKGTQELDGENPKSGVSSKTSIFVPEIPKECEKLNVCENVPNYPYEYAEKLIDKAGFFNHLNVDILTWKMKMQEESMLDGRVLCKSIPRFYHPEAGKTMDGRWVYILNKRYTHIQGGVYERCLHPKTTCFEKVYGDTGNEFICDQRYVLTPMWALTEEGFMVLESFPMPSCCSCLLIKNGTASESRQHDSLLAGVEV